MVWNILLSTNNLESRLENFALDDANGYCDWKNYEIVEFKCCGCCVLSLLELQHKFISAVLLCSCLMLRWSFFLWVTYGVHDQLENVLIYILSTFSETLDYPRAGLWLSGIPLKEIELFNIHSINSAYCNLLHLQLQYWNEVHLCIRSVIVFEDHRVTYTLHT